MERVQYREEESRGLMEKRTSGDDGTRVNEIDEVNGSHSTKKLIRLIEKKNQLYMREQHEKEENTCKKKI